MSFQQDPLWLSYEEKRDTKVKEQLIVKYISLVKYVAGRMMISLPPSVEKDDLESAGIMGLIDAIDRYDPKYGVKFESYAIPRIKGAILDELRKLDWVPRSVRSKAKELEKVIFKIESEKGGPATDEEISKNLNISMQEYFDILKEIGTTTLLSLDDAIFSDDGGKASLHEVIEDKGVENPMEEINREELKEMIQIMKPKFFLPIHGQYSMLVAHSDIAKEAGLDERNIVIAENGQIICVSQKRIYVEKTGVPSNYVMVDGLGIGDVGEIVLRDRQMLAKDGMFVIVAIVDKQTGKVKGSPDIISRGFVYLRESKDLLRETRKKVIEIIHRATDSGGAVNWTYIKDEIRNKIGQFFFAKTKRRPMILPVVIEV